MKYSIEDRNIPIILDALQFVLEHMNSCSRDEFNYPYSIDDVDKTYLDLEHQYMNQIDNNGEYTE